MSIYLFDFAFVAIAGLTTWIVARRLVIDSAAMFLAIVIAGLVSMVVFEPLAEACREHLFLFNDLTYTKFLWPFFAIGIFVLVFISLYIGFLHAVGKTPELGRMSESVGCWVIGGLAGYFLAAFLLTVVHTVPASRNFGGFLIPEAHRRPGLVTAFAPDYQFLAFTEYTCTPHSALTGRPWKLDRPVVSVSERHGHWPSFFLRYALWREELEYLDYYNNQKSSDSSEPAWRRSISEEYFKEP